MHEAIGGHCIVVDRHYGPDDRHGRHPVANIVRTLQASIEGFAALGRAWPGTRGVVPRAGPLLQDLDGLCVVDLETTGLAGGAGTQAFLVGCARIDGDGIAIRQFLSPGFEHERAQLHLVSEWMRDRTQLLTFNGRTFDVPLLEMRFSYHRLAWPWGTLPHLDALHPARRFWRDRSEIAGPDPDDASCSLGVLERRLSGLHRVGDVPASRFRRATSSSPATAGPSRSRRCSSTTGSTCCRRCWSARAPPRWSSSGQARPRAATSAWAWAACTIGWDSATTPRRATCTRRRSAGGWAMGGCAARRCAGWRWCGGEPAGPRPRPTRGATCWPTRGASALARREAREALAIYHEHRAHDLAAARASCSTRWPSRSTTVGATPRSIAWRGSSGS